MEHENPTPEKHTSNFINSDDSYHSILENSPRAFQLLIAEKQLNPGKIYTTQAPAQHGAERQKAV